MTDAVVAKRYAQALFSLSEKEGSRDAHGEGLAEFAQMLELEPKLGLALKSPALRPDEKKAVIGRLLERIGADATLRNFFFLLADKDRLGSLASIAAEYGAMLDHANGVRRGSVTTAIELSPEKRAELKAALEQKAGGAMVLEFKVDPEILGGVVLAVGDKVMDSSLRAQLGVLREALIRGV